MCITIDLASICASLFMHFTSVHFICTKARTQTSWVMDAHFILVTIQVFWYVMQYQFVSSWVPDPDDDGIITLWNISNYFYHWTPCNISETLVFTNTALRTSNLTPFICDHNHTIQSGCTGSLSHPVSLISLSRVIRWQHMAHWYTVAPVLHVQGSGLDFYWHMYRLLKFFW